MDLHAYHRALNLGFSESEASRIGDDAWENNRQQPTCELEPEPDYYDVLVAENTQLRAAISLLEAKLEIEQMRLVACSVVSLANTPESAAQARNMHPDYRSFACDDVARMVDREIAQRATISRLREYAGHKDECNWWRMQEIEPLPIGETRCDCGYDALLKELEGTK